MLPTPLLCECLLLVATQTELSAETLQGVVRDDNGRPVAGAPIDNVAADEHPFELLVVGTDGKPIREAVVELRTTPVPAAEQIQRGKFLRKGSYGMFVMTDAEGRLFVKLPPKPTRFNVSIATPGYAPYWAGWSPNDRPEPIPSRFTAELDSGWSVGGIIVDDEGQPVEGAKVRPSIKFKKRPGDLDELGLSRGLVAGTVHPQFRPQQLTRLASTPSPGRRDPTELPAPAG